MTVNYHKPKQQSLEANAMKLGFSEVRGIGRKMKKKYKAFRYQQWDFFFKKRQQYARQQ